MSKNASVWVFYILTSLVVPCVAIATYGIGAMFWYCGGLFAGFTYRRLLDGYERCR